MKVTIKESGGLAPGLRRAPEVLDSDSLSEEQAAKLIELVADAKNANENAGNPPDRARDAVKYTVFVEDEKGEAARIEQSDSTLTQPVADLVDWVRRNNK